MSRRNGTSYATIAKRLKVSETTVRRWLDPTYAALQERIKKRNLSKYTGVCEDCGTETKYNPRHPDKVSHVCRSCQSKRLTSLALARRVWTQDLAIAALRNWADEHGQPPLFKEWKPRVPGYPSTATIITLFGSWNEGIKAAGFEPRSSDIREHAASWKLQKGEDH